MLSAAPNPYGVPGKRFVGSVARTGRLPGKRADDPQVEELLLRELAAAELAAAEHEWQQLHSDGKRSLASLARGGALPGKRVNFLEPEQQHVATMVQGKRNVGSLARAGGFSALRYAGAKKSDGLNPEEEKRSVVTRPMGSLGPMGKRYLGALARARLLPNLGAGDKRNIGAMARNWYLPSQGRPGKRGDVDEDGYDGDDADDGEDYEEAEGDGDVDALAKRYVAALLRQGRLPVGGGPGGPGADYAADAADAADADRLEEKRHLGALRRLGKKASAPMAPKSRTKRQAPPVPSDEYPLPVYQPSDQADYDLTGGEGPDKRFLGRIPQMGRSRGRAQSPLRRERPRARNI